MLKETFENYLKDDQQAWVLQPDASYRRVKSSRKQGHSAQQWLLDQLTSTFNVRPMDTQVVGLFGQVELGQAVLRQPRPSGRLEFAPRSVPLP